jgi:hypothetical protein
MSCREHEQRYSHLWPSASPSQVVRSRSFSPLMNLILLPRNHLLLFLVPTTRSNFVNP